MCRHVPVMTLTRHLLTHCEADEEEEKTVCLIRLWGQDSRLGSTVYGEFHVILSSV